MTDLAIWALRWSGSTILSSNKGRLSSSSRTSEATVGFIVPDDAGGDIYFQERDVQPDAQPHITDGVRVEFEVVPVTKGRQVKNVKII